MTKGIRIRMLLMAGVIAALAATSALAGDAIAIRTKIPFDFMIGDKLAPAGEYTFEQNASWSSIRITSWDTGTALTLLRHPADRNYTGFAYALVFNKYGDRYFLNQVWAGPGTDGVQLPRSRSEKEAMVVRTPTRTMLAATVVR